MELHPVWEKGNPLNPELWYVLSAIGDAPSMRVGHTASHITGGSSSDGKVYFIAGANPDGQLAEVYTLDLETFSWDIIDCKDFKARYEHVAFTPDSDPSKVYILLGAEKTGSVNDIQVFDTSTNEWESLQVNGSPPSARTHHSTAQLGDCIYVYSGGEQGSEPVPDKLVHCFDATTSTWSFIETENQPQSRHGHILLAYNNKLILHGGMSGQIFYDDLSVLDLETKKWRNIKPRKIYPSARAAHGGTVIGSSAYVFGGMGRHGALDDLFRLDLETFKWQRVTLQGPAPTPRLDFAMTSVTARIPVMEGQSVAEQTRDALQKLEGLTVDVNSETGGARSNKHELTVNDSPPGVAVPHPTPNTERYGTVSLLLVHGGMDTDGELWDDTLVFLVDNELRSNHDEQRHLAAMTGTKNAEKRHLTVLAVINNAEKSQLAAMTETNNAEKRHLAVMKETNNGAQRHLAAMAGTNGAQRHLAVMTETNERNGPRLSGEDLFSCSICYERLYRAKILNCLHTFCQLCLERHDGLGMPRSRIKQFKVISCPNCREQTVMSRGIEGLPEDSSLTKMAALLTRVNQMLQSPERSTEPTDPGQARLQLDHLQDSIRLQMSSIHAKMLKLAVVELNNLNEPQTVVLHSKSKKVRLVETEEYNPLLAKLKRIQDTLYVANSNLKSFTSVADEAIAKLSSAQLHSILEHLVKIGEEILIEQSERISACELIYKSLIPKDGEQISKIEYESDLYENVKISLKWRIGQRGSSPGMFEWPVDVAFANDQILVADKNNRRVQIFDLQGQFLQSLGENDLAPKRIVVNGQEFHVSDELGLCVKIFRNKDLADSWGEGRFTSPCGFAMDTQKDFIMSDAEMGLVSVFNREFSLTAVFKTRAPSDTSAPNPYFIATNSDDQIIVSDSYNNCIKIFAKTGQLLLTFGRGLLACPRGVCLDSEGNILVVDSDHHKVRLFDGFGQFKRDILTSSHGLSYPMGIDLREKMLVVTQCAFYGGHELKMYTFEYDE